MPTDPKQRTDAGRINAEHGLICAFALQGDAPPRSIELSAVAPTVVGEEAVVWLHFSASNAGARRWLAHAGCAPAELLRFIEDHEARVQISADQSSLLAVLTDLAFAERIDPSEVVTLWIYASDHLIVTARNHAAQSADILRRSARDRMDASSGQAVLARLLEVQADLLRARAALHRLLLHSADLRGGIDANVWRGVHDEFAFAVDEATALYERAKLLQEELASRLAEATSRNLYILTICTIVFLPMTLISGIFGMNIAGVPGVGEQSSAAAFWWVMALIVAAGGLTFLRIRMRRFF